MKSRETRAPSSYPRPPDNTYWCAAAGAATSYHNKQHILTLYYTKIST